LIVARSKRERWIIGERRRRGKLPTGS
jgi:hypothetical protein